MDERLKFVARLLDGEKMAILCREFGISRPTGYKIYNRYKHHGLEGLKERSCRPYRHANQLPFQIERTILCIKPGNPQQNGRHERMHRTLKEEAARPASFNFLQQQGRFDDFIEVYNNERPHQALNMKYPGEVYTPSARIYQPPDEPDYPYHDRTIRITQCGRICIGKRKINLSTVFAGQTVGIREVADNIWLVSFLDYDLGFFDEEEGRVEPATNPFLLKV
jgi:hypothetical protein